MNKKHRKIHSGERILAVLFIIFLSNHLQAQKAMVNVQSRNLTNLIGDWNVIIDPTGVGDWKQVWQEKKPQKKTDVCPTYPSPDNYRERGNWLNVFKRINEISVFLLLETINTPVLADILDE